MPIVVECPSCQRKLSVPDNLLGKKVRCPSCQNTFTASGEEPESPAADEGGGTESSTSARRSRREERPAETDDDRPRRKRQLEPLEDEDFDEEPSEDEEADYEEEPRPRRRRGRKRAKARKAVFLPALFLMIIAGLSLALYLLQLVLIFAGFDVNPFRQAGAPPTPAEKAGAVGGTIVAMCWAGIVLTGANKMRQLEGLGYAKTASIMAMIPCNICCLFGLPIGIWSLVILNKPEVKSAFR